MGDYSSPIGTIGVVEQHYGEARGGNVEIVEEKTGSKKIWLGSYCELVDVKTEVGFILQYELDKDPFETFGTMKEVEARIKELVKRADLNRDSIKVYEIAKTYDIRLETRIVFDPKVTITKTKKRTKK